MVVVTQGKGGNPAATPQLPGSGAPGIPAATPLVPPGLGALGSQTQRENQGTQTPRAEQGTQTPREQGTQTPRERGTQTPREQGTQTPRGLATSELEAPKPQDTSPRQVFSCSGGTIIYNVGNTATGDPHICAPAPTPPPPAAPGTAAGRPVKTWDNNCPSKMEFSGVIECTICGSWVKGGRCALQQHQLTSSKCAAASGRLESGREPCPSCGKMLAASDAWAAEQHRRFCRPPSRSAGYRNSNRPATASNWYGRSPHHSQSSWQGWEQPAQQEPQTHEQAGSTDQTGQGNSYPARERLNGSQPNAYSSWEASGSQTGPDRQNQPEPGAAEPGPGDVDKGSVSGCKPHSDPGNLAEEPPAYSPPEEASACDAPGTTEPEPSQEGEATHDPGPVMPSPAERLELQWQEVTASLAETKLGAHLLTQLRPDLPRERQIDLVSAWQQDIADERRAQAAVVKSLTEYWQIARASGVQPATSAQGCGAGASEPATSAQGWGAGGCGGAPESVASGATARSVSRWHRVVPPPDNEAEWQQLDLDEAEDV